MIAPFLLTIGILCDPERSDSAPSRELVELASPWFEVRARAQSRLLALHPSEGQEIATRLLADPDPRLRLAAVEWYREQIDLGCAVAEAPFAAAYLVEKDALVRDRAVHVAAALPAVVESARARVARGDVAPAEYDALLDARIVRLCEAVMLDGGVPGFFDGQFAAIHAVDDTALLRMLRFTWDPRLHPVMRTLMIMALHEPRPPSLEMFLQPMLIPASIEVLIQHTFTWKFNTSAMDVRQNLVASYSQYARFSLAKAGIAGPIDQKIAELRTQHEEYAKRARNEFDEDHRDFDRDRAEFDLQIAMDFLFQVGYHQQQLDRYDAAEEAYRTIIASEINVRSKRWAHYNLACIRAIQGRNDDAIDELTKAVHSGFNDVRWAARDGDLKPLRDDPRFKRLLAGLPPPDAATKPGDR